MRKFIGPSILTISLALGLYLLFMLYSTGQTMLACICLGALTLTGYIFTSSRAYAYRYLFPGVAAVMVFVLLPLVYTVSIGFTNFSSKNLLTFERATQYLLDETQRTDSGGYAMTLYGDGKQFRIKLERADTNELFLSGPLALRRKVPLKVDVAPLDPLQTPLPGQPLGLKDVIEQQAELKMLTLVMPNKIELRMVSLREFGPIAHVYAAAADGNLKKLATGELIKPNFQTGFYQSPEGESLEPGFKVNVGFANFARIFADQAFREPFLRIFVWTVVFSTITVATTTGLGMALAVLLNWDALQFRGLYRTLLFLPYAVPGFISILVFKGLFNNNFGEINLVLDALFGIKPAWFSDTTLAKTMILIVNTWLGYPYMMVVCMGLIKAIPADLYEASALAGAGPLTNFFKITMPLIIKPLTPLMVASLGFNFNNFVLISLLTGGRPDFLDTKLPAGTTDLLVSYTYRIAFEDSGQNFGLAAAISTIIFLLVAAISLVNMRLTRMNKA
ncbi:MULTISPECIES: maltose ABC transporter permease MalF [unclassified Janthinobacterium]|uniref:maltose ABC transporter permease MalF n=1 Tax=unclassified Janthinobacterium TaxID=2610881 RepID=UPI00034BF354|nr:MULTISPECIES: maltose ABC transporter permease MalF [unclassified Janthinobacterium]MEC5163188.1 maltose/maltodextrin transport system permease protein [Janthinobacterium sp. CG_S6]